MPRQAKFRIIEDSYYSCIEPVNYPANVDGFKYFASFKAAKRKLMSNFRIEIRNFKASLKSLKTLTEEQVKSSN